MQLRDPELWATGKANNPDPYGSEVYRYAEAWADLMEAAMAKGDKLEDVAKATSHKADTTGITGYMYGAAVSILASTWQHGEALRRWHNIDVQIGSEGERANEKGTVLNPALLSIGEP
jgi:hypothetical protein